MTITRHGLRADGAKTACDTQSEPTDDADETPVRCQHDEVFSDYLKDYGDVRPQNTAAMAVTGLITAPWTTGETSTASQIP